MNRPDSGHHHPARRRTSAETVKVKPFGCFTTLTATAGLCGQGTAGDGERMPPAGGWFKDHPLEGLTSHQRLNTNIGQFICYLYRSF
jgi:hypothetical protein